ncbi:MAG: spore germination protein [Clostridiales bacterium]|nr:spore germination protein [Clostridiales bacterium]
MFRKKNRHEEILKALMADGRDISKKVIEGAGSEVYILYIKQLTDRIMLSNYIIRPLMQYLSKNRTMIDAVTCANQIIYSDDCHVESVEEKILESLLNGMTVLLFSEEQEFLVVNNKKVEKKSVESPELTFTLRGPRDSFLENLDVNLSLIRYRIKDPELKILMLEAGKRTRTRIAVVYISDIANSSIVEKIESRIRSINTDGIVESGELQKCLLNNQFNLFPQIGLVERSDMACAAMLEGKVIIVIEGSGLALVAPKTFGEFLWSCDDNYDNQYMALFTKILRIISIFISITLGSLFVIYSSFNPDLLPPEYIITLAFSRANVPFNAFTGALLMEIIVEILREALLRIPKQIGPAIGIVGAIIIGQAAIAAGVFSPLLMIMVSLSLMASFVVPDYSIMNPLRVMKFFMLVLTGIFGLLGFSLGLCFIITSIISTSSFGVPYLAPFAPFNWYDFTRTFFYSKKIAKKRPNFLKTKDNTRTKK